MRYTLITVFVGLAALQPSLAAAHALFPGQQVVKTMGERAWVRLQAVNARQDTSQFAVEVFDAGSWRPSAHAVATPSQLTVPAPDKGSMEATNRTISVLVDMDGKAEQRLRVCTKTIFPRITLIPQTTNVNTRVCANVTVQRFQP